MPTSDVRRPAVVERTRRLRRSIVRTARLMTVASGLGGFTVEQVCAEVGVSRRTFFNHFASKEDAVLGVEIDADDGLLERFASGDLEPGVPPFAAVLRIAAAHVQDSDLDREHEGRLREVLAREPALVTRLIAATDRQLDRIADAVRVREDWPPGDHRARLVVELAATVLKTAATRFLDDPDADFAAVLDDTIAFTIATTTSSTSSARETTA